MCRLALVVFELGTRNCDLQYLSILNTILTVTICTRQIISLIVMLALKHCGRQYQMPFVYPCLVSTETIEIPDGARSRLLHIEGRFRSKYLS